MNTWKDYKKGDYKMGRLKNEYKSFLDDIEKNIKNKEDLEYVKQRFATFLDIVVDQMDVIMDYKKEEITKLEETQDELNSKMNQMQQVIDNIEKDIYAEEGFDFEIVCPYCHYEFIIDVDENKTEIQCPECQNIIELDWSGDEEDKGECNGNCHGCQNCDDDDDDM